MYDLLIYCSYLRNSSGHTSVDQNVFEHIVLMYKTSIHLWLQVYHEALQSPTRCLWTAPKYLSMQFSYRQNNCGQAEAFNICEHFTATCWIYCSFSQNVYILTFCDHSEHSLTLCTYPQRISRHNSASLNISGHAALTQKYLWTCYGSSIQMQTKLLRVHKKRNNIEHSSVPMNRNHSCPVTKRLRCKTKCPCGFSRASYAC